MTGEISNVAHSIHERLLNICRESGGEFENLLRRFAYERFLYRLSQSSYADKLVLKGAFLLILWSGDYYRPTKDLDMLVRAITSEDEIRKLFEQVCAISFERDGLVFDTSRLSVEEIRENEVYQGLRIKFRAFLGSARIPLQVDLGFDDVVKPRAIKYSSLLNLPAPRLLSYPPESVIAEKVETIVVKGMQNSRMKDFYDVHCLLRVFRFDGETLKEAIKAAFTKRKTTIPADIPLGLSDEFADDESKQAQWRGFIKKNELSNAPEILSAVIEEIRLTILPIFSEIRQRK